MSVPSALTVRGSGVDSCSVIWPPGDGIVGVIVITTSVPVSTARSPASSITRGSRPVWAGKRYSTSIFCAYGRSTTSSVKVDERTPAASARNSRRASTSNTMLSKPPWSFFTIGTRSNCVASPFFTSSTASSALKPESVATKV